MLLAQLKSFGSASNFEVLWIDPCSDQLLPNIQHHRITARLSIVHHDSQQGPNDFSIRTLFQFGDTLSSHFLDQLIRFVNEIFIVVGKTRSNIAFIELLELLGHRCVALVPRVAQRREIVLSNRSLCSLHKTETNKEKADTNTNQHRSLRKDDFE